LERIMRRMIGFECEGVRLAATLDEGDKPTGLLIVSGGNEIRSGAHGGQAAMAAHFAALGYPVLRYDRRGIGESEGENGGFEASSPDIAAAVSAFRREVSGLVRLVAFGNCDAATALALHQQGLGIDALVLANPWVIEAVTEGASTPASPAAIRARYWNRLKNPRSLIDLVTGKIDLKKLAGGLAKASKSEAPTGLAARLADALVKSTVPAAILIAERDTTALAFMAAWKDASFAPLRERPGVTLAQCATASHSFADASAKAWLLDRIGYVLRG
jgi:exosortase A-associated hydrolase 1